MTIYKETITRESRSPIIRKFFFPGLCTIVSHIPENNSQLAFFPLRIFLYYYITKVRPNWIIELGIVRAILLYVYTIIYYRCLGLSLVEIQRACLMWWHYARSRHTTYLIELSNHRT